MDLVAFRIGGPNSVRGFPSSEVSGDQGFDLTVEVQRPFKLAADVPAVFKVFWDGGMVHRMDETRGPPPSNGAAHASLTSIGVGLSVSYAEDYSFEVVAARPLDPHDPSDSLGRGRMWANFSAQF